MEARYRDHLPPLDGELFLTDGGLETYLIFQRGIDLPEFAAFDLIKDDAGRAELSDYYRPYLDLAGRYGAGFIIETPTWRANPGWGAAVGYDEPGLARVNAAAVELVEPLRNAADALRSLASQPATSTARRASGAWYCVRSAAAKSAESSASSTRSCLSA